jgi:sterol 3beta-glucosyltransferase
VFNLYDGFTGVVTHPYRDTKKEGVVGFGKGVGRGAGGLVLKTMAAVFGVPAYTLKGVEKQVEKRADRDLKITILKSRLKQGLEDFRVASEEEKEEIVRRWKELNEQ